MLGFVLAFFLISAYRIFCDIFRSRFQLSSMVLLALPITLFAFYDYLSNRLALNRFTETFQEGSNAATSATVRFTMWDEARAIWLDNPISILLGSGFQKFSILMSGATSDSFYLDHLATYGLLPFFIYVLYLMMIIYKSSNKILVVILVITAAIVGLTGNVLSDPIVFSTFLLTLAWIGHEKEKA